MAGPGLDQTVELVVIFLSHPTLRENLNERSRQASNKYVVARPVQHEVPAAGVLGSPRARGAAGGRGAGVRGRLQLRGLPDGHRQPLRGRHPGLPRHGAPAVRRDLLRLPHRPRLRRPRRRRLHR
jgi:hypothetical protein